MWLVFCFAPAAEVLAQNKAATAGPPSLEEAFHDEYKSVLGEKSTTSDPAADEHRKLIDAILEDLRSSEQNKRIDGAIFLERVIQKSDVSYLLQRMGDFAPDPAMQAVIITALGTTHDASSALLLKKEFDMGAREVKLAIIEAYGKMKDESVVQPLASIAAGTDDPEILRRVAISLAAIGTPKALYVLQGISGKYSKGILQIIYSLAVKKANGELSDTKTDEEIPEAQKVDRSFEGLRYYFYRPVSQISTPPNVWLLVCIHGSDLALEQLFDNCQATAKQNKMAALVPFFDPIRFPEYDTFNLRGPRSDRILLDLIDFLRERAHLRTKEFYLFGLEKGGDFAQRFALSNPTRMARVAFQASSYVAIDPNLYFPFGLRPPLRAPDLQFDLAAIVKMDMGILILPDKDAPRLVRKFYEPLATFADGTDVTTHIRLRPMKPDQTGIPGTWQAAQAYLFGEN